MLIVSRRVASDGGIRSSKRESSQTGDALMRFFHASIYGQQFTEAVTLSSTGRNAPPLPLIVACPQCNDWYFAGLAAGEKPWKFEQVTWQAQQVLAGECPDHAHRFDVASG